MTRTLIFLAIVCCVSAASDLKQSRARIDSDELLDGVISGVRGVGSLARMVSALMSALEILMFVILKNLAENLTIPNQVLNLLQVGIYFVMG